MPISTEWTFAADVAGWFGIYLERHPELPFSHAKVEQKAEGSLKRGDLLLYDKKGRVVLTGETKMPDAPDGLTPFDARAVSDARRKAKQHQSRFFFTWNVNQLVLWQTDAEFEVQTDSVLSVLKREHIDRPQNQNRLREFCGQFLEGYARLLASRTTLGALPLDVRFIRRFEADLYAIAGSVIDEVQSRHGTSSVFRRKINQWMKDQGWALSDDSEIIALNLDNATRLATYIAANKLVFYQALRKTREFRLPKLSVPAHLDDPERLKDHFHAFFDTARRVTSDYETIFFGDDYVDRVPFLSEEALPRWKALVDLLNQFDFRDFSQDLIGHIFEDLLSPEQRHRWGQHYTSPELVNLICAFCIREPDARVLDPASGSGTFPVGAYARKKFLANGSLSHGALLEQIFACEINPYAAHLTSLNLATRDLIDGENFPYVAKSDFFKTGDDVPFCEVPERLSVRKKLGEIAMRDVFVKEVDCVMGNPPYLEQTSIEKKDKKRYQDVVVPQLRGLPLGGRSDLHVYFWPHAARLLQEGGWFGFLTSSSWLDVDYGFRLQHWILNNFRIHAIIESSREPWFTGARVATSVVILQKCSDEKDRMSSLVRFVQLRQPIKQLLEHDETQHGKMEAAEALRDQIEKARKDVENADLRIRIVSQKELWRRGTELSDDPEIDNGTRDYAGSKWGVFLRAPQLYFDLMKTYGKLIVPLSEIADVKYGFKSGCDGYFILKDRSANALADESDPSEFAFKYRCARKHVVSGTVKVMEGGDHSLHPIESRYLVKEVHSLMHIENIRIKEEDLEHWLLCVAKYKDELKGTHVERYISHGEKEMMGEKVPIAERPSCSGRDPWYNLGDLTKAPIIFPIIVQYRHIVPYNEEEVPVNHAMMTISPAKGIKKKVLAAVLNSTLIAFFKPFFSRRLGNEANTQLDVYAAKTLPVLDLRKISKEHEDELLEAFDEFADRPVTQLVEQRLMGAKNVEDSEGMNAEPEELPEELKQRDRQRLDRAVLAALGVPAREIGQALKTLYREVTLHGNQLRKVELLAMRNRQKVARKISASPKMVAEEIFATLNVSVFRRFPADFIPDIDEVDTFEIRPGKVTLYPDDDMLHANHLFVGTTCFKMRHRAMAELAELHLRISGPGFIRLPIDAKLCLKIISDWHKYASEATNRIMPLVEERVDDEVRQEAVFREICNRLDIRLWER